MIMRSWPESGWLHNRISATMQKNKKNDEVDDDVPMGNLVRFHPPSIVRSIGPQQRVL